MEQQNTGLQQLGFGASFFDELCAMLETIPLFSDLTRPEIEVLAKFTQAYSAEPEVTLFQEGQHDRFMCFLIEGRLKVFKEADDGSHRELAIIRPGKSIGEMSLIDQQPHSATVISTEPSTLVMLSHPHLARLSAEHPRLALKLVWKLAEMLSSRLRQTSGQLIDHL